MRRIIPALFLLLSASLVVVGQDLPVPDVTDLSVDAQIAEINNTVESLPTNIDPNLIPAETATQLFAYMKWVFSTDGAYELLGQSLAPIGINLFLLLTIALTFVILWMTIRMLVFTWRLFLFIVEWIIRMIELIPFAQ